MADGLLIAGGLLLSVVGGLLVVRVNRRAFIREKPDWRTFALALTASTLSSFALAWLVGPRDRFYLASMELFFVIVCVGTFVWPPMPSD
jgi:hypothetical protein